MAVSYWHDYSITSNIGRQELRKDLAVTSVDPAKTRGDLAMFRVDLAKTRKDLAEAKKDQEI